jgi:hypothetical protein
MASFNRKQILIASAAVGAIVIGILLYRRQKRKSVPHALEEINPCWCREDDAIARMESIRNISYDLKLKLAKVISGTIQIGFECLDVNLPVWVDYTGDPINKVQINSIPIQAIFSSHSIPLTGLKVGDNYVKIDFTSQIVPKPGWSMLKLGSDTYYYSNFKGFAAHNLFPCIDQPNFKAAWKVSISLPSVYKAICSAKLESVTTEGVLNVYSYSGECSISSFSLNIGKFESYSIGTDLTESTIYFPKEIQAEIPQHLFLLRSWIDEILLFLRDTAQLKMVDSYFNIIVGLEENHFQNTCLISIDFFTKPRAEQKLHLFYSLASQWFEHNIGYEWWDDIWIHESIAQLLVHIYIDKTQDEDLKSILIMQKGKYMKVELTSPTLNSERIVDEAPTSWEGSGVKYGYMLYQLYLSIGPFLTKELLHKLLNLNSIHEETFLKCVKNTLGAKVEIVDLKIEEFLNRMVTQNSLAVFIPEFMTSDKNMILKLNITQVAEPHLPFKANLLSLTLPDLSFSTSCYQIRSRTETVILDSNLNKMQWVMLLDCDDMIWGLVQYDRKFIAKIKNNIYRIRGVLHRLIIWRNLYLLVFRESLSWMHFVNMAISEVNYEKNEIVLNYVLRLCVDVFDSLPIDTEHQFSNRLLETILKYQVKASQKIINELVYNEDSERILRRYGFE